VGSLNWERLVIRSLPAVSRSNTKPGQISGHGLVPVKGENRVLMQLSSPTGTVSHRRCERGLFMPTKQNAQSAFSIGSLQPGGSRADVHVSPTLCRSTPCEPTDLPIGQSSIPCSQTSSICVVCDLKYYDIIYIM
jgi:hypothetical protein